jgi:hypothetical protein
MPVIGAYGARPSRPPFAPRLAARYRRRDAAATAGVTPALHRPGMNIALSHAQEVLMNKDDRLSNWEDKEIRDRNANGIDDAIEPDPVDIRAGADELSERLELNTHADPSLSAGDIDARWEEAESGGDETVAGSMATPGQNDVAEMGKAIGIEYADDEPLRVGEKERDRDKDRFELDPASSEDWQERNRDRER